MSWKAQARGKTSILENGRSTILDSARYV